MSCSDFNIFRIFFRLCVIILVFYFCFVVLRGYRKGEMKDIFILINCLKFVGKDLMIFQVILVSGFGFFLFQFFFIKTNCYLNLLSLVLIKMKRSSCFKDNSIKVLWKLKIILGFKEIVEYVNGGWFGDWFSLKVVFLNFLRNCFDFVYFIRQGIIYLNCVQESDIEIKSIL